jgi:hypothetical protein
MRRSDGCGCLFTNPRFSRVSSKLVTLARLMINRSAIWFGDTEVSESARILRTNPAAGLRSKGRSKLVMRFSSISAVKIRFITHSVAVALASRPLFEYRHAYSEDESFDAYNAERLRPAHLLLLGRSSYQGFKRYWPSEVDDPNATPANRKISQLENTIEKLVVSDSLTPDQTEPWHNTRTRRLPYSNASPAKIS